MLQLRHQKFQEQKLHEIFKWNPRGQLPLAYFLTKNKDVLKQRPIVAACNHSTKHTLQICAKGGSLLLHMADSKEHFNITTTCSSLWSALRATEDQGNNVVLGFDINQMFTMLPHGQVERTILRFVNVMIEKTEKDTSISCQGSPKQGREEEDGRAESSQPHSWTCGMHWNTK
jgi:hypothetical protein